MSGSTRSDVWYEFDRFGNLVLEGGETPPDLLGECQLPGPGFGIVDEASRSVFDYHDSDCSLKRRPSKAATTVASHEESVPAQDMGHEGPGTGGLPG